MLFRERKECAFLTAISKGAHRRETCLLTFTSSLPGPQKAPIIFGPPPKNLDCNLVQPTFRHHIRRNSLRENETCPFSVPFSSCFFQGNCFSVEADLYRVVSLSSPWPMVSSSIFWRRLKGEEFC